MTGFQLRRPGVARMVERVVEAHGGMERWQKAAAVELFLSSGGMAFAAKGEPDALHELSAIVATAGQSIELRGRRPQPWQVRFDGDGRHGTVSLRDSLAALRRGRRRLVWSVADVGAFAAAALWTYVQVPFVLADPTVEVEELGSWSEKGKRWMRLAVTFPAHLATHCPRQVLYVDSEHRLRRHDYTALAFGRWARVAQYLSGYRQFDGLSLATRRRVFPRLPGGRCAAWPQLVWIDVHHVVLR